MQRTVRIAMPVDQARALGVNLQAMVRAFEGEAIAQARRGLITRSLQFESKAEECRNMLEIIEEAIAHRPRPLYDYETSEVRA